MATQTHIQQAQVEYGDGQYDRATCRATPPRMKREVPKFVPKVEIRELIKEVPDIQIEWIEKRVEIPSYEYVDVYEHVEQRKEVIKEVCKIQVVDVPVEQIEYQKKIEEKIVEKIIEIPSKTNIINLPQEGIEYIPHIVPRYVDKEIPVVVNHTIEPIIQETSDVMEVAVAKYVPELIPIDIYVPKPVNVPITRDEKNIMCSNITETERTTLPYETLQQLIIQMNPHIQQLNNFNKQQVQFFRETHEKSTRLAAKHGFAPPDPIDPKILNGIPSQLQDLNPEQVYHPNQHLYIQYSGESCNNTNAIQMRSEMKRQYVKNVSSSNTHGSASTKKTGEMQHIQQQITCPSDNIAVPVGKKGVESPVNYNTRYNTRTTTRVYSQVPKNSNSSDSNQYHNMTHQQTTKM